MVRISRKKGYKFNMLLDWCVGKAASSIKEFYLLPVGDKLMQYESLAVNTIVKNKDGEVSSCDIPYTEDLEQFNRQYLESTQTVAESCSDMDLSDKCMVIGTSAIIDTEINGAPTPESSWPICRKRFTGCASKFPVCRSPGSSSCQPRAGLVS